MTTLTITPNWKNKTARFKGTIAAGEHVAVRIVNDNGEGDEYIQAEDLANLRLRVVNPANGKTLAQFPMPQSETEVLPTVALEEEEIEETGETGETEEAGDTSETGEAWGGLTPLTCELDLNTDRMLMAVPPAANVPLLFVLDAYRGATDEDAGEFTLYFKDMCEVTHWPRRVGEEEPTNLDDYADIIADFREDIYGEGGFEDRLDAAEAAVDTAVTETIPNALGQIDGKVATAVATSLSGKVDKIPGKGLSENDYTDADKAKLAGIAAGAEVNVQSDWNQGDTSAKDFIKNKPTALKNPAALIFGTKTYDGSVAKEITAADLGALTSHQDISGKADKSTTYTKAEVDAIVAAVKTGSRQVVASLSDVTDPQPLVIYMVAKSPSQTNNAYDEYIWLPSGNSGSWEKIGDTTIDLSGYKTKQTAVSDPVASTDTSLTFIDSISQDVNGVISATKKTVERQVIPIASKTSSGIVQIGDGINVENGVISVPPLLLPGIEAPSSTASVDAIAGARSTGEALEGKADKSEMIMTAGTGENADKVTINLKSGTSATVLTEHQDLSNLAAAADLRYAFAAPLLDANDRAVLVDRAVNRFTGTSQYSPFEWSDEGDYGDPTWDSTNNEWVAPAALTAAYAASSGNVPFDVYFSYTEGTSTEAVFTGWGSGSAADLTVSAVQVIDSANLAVTLTASNGWSVVMPVQYTEVGTEEYVWIMGMGSQGAWTVEGPGALANYPEIGDTIPCSIYAESGIPVTATRSLRTLGTFVPPAAAPGHMRDFLVRLDLTGVSGTAPSIGWSATDAGSAAVSYEAKGGTFPEFEAGVVNFVSFTEFEPGVLTVKHETAEAVVLTSGGGGE